VGAGFEPLFIAYTEPSIGTRAQARPELRLYGSLLFAPDLYVRLTRVRAATDIGLQAGYRYNTLLGSGVAGGLYVQHPLGNAMDLLITGGVLVFPDGETQLREKQDLPKNAEFGFPGPGVALSVSMGLLFFP
jgi:hypothetical protein